MKEPKLLLKIVVLSLFIFLLISFTAYRAGVLPNIIGESAFANAEYKTDSPSYDNQREIMSSSKSGAIFRETPQANAQDTTPQQRSANNPPVQQTNRPHNNQPDRRNMMPSSKSGPVFLPHHDSSSHHIEPQQQK